MPDVTNDASLQELIEALAPFAAAADRCDEKSARMHELGMGHMADGVSTGWGITRKHCTAARSALRALGLIRPDDGET